jgi:hypothetical protein
MLFTLFRTLISALQSQRALAMENLALRHQLSVLQRAAKKPRLRGQDRLLWVLLSRVWTGWREILTIVQPETVIRWHREGFRLYWRWKGRGVRGRPKISKEIRDLIRQMSTANPLWGAPRIHGELLKLGIEIGQTAVSKYMVRHRKPPSQNWQTFLENHAKEIVSIDLFTVPTATFRVLFVFLILSNHHPYMVHLSRSNNYWGDRLTGSFLSG